MDSGPPSPMYQLAAFISVPGWTRKAWDTSNSGVDKLRKNHRHCGHRRMEKVCKHQWNCGAPPISGDGQQDHFVVYLVLIHEAHSHSLQKTDKTFSTTSQIKRGQPPQNIVNSRTPSKMRKNNPCKRKVQQRSQQGHSCIVLEFCRKNKTELFTRIQSPTKACAIRVRGPL